MKSYKITDELFLNEYHFTVATKEEVKPKHQYIIIDRSGSMWHDIDHTVDIIIEYVDTLPEGSTVSLGYFSGTSEYGLSVPYELKKEKDGIVKTVNEYRKTLGCTNFTEILEKVKKDLRTNSSLFFFTDGCHNCGSFSDVLKELKQLKSSLDIALFVGCGWINRQNMIDMANEVDGSFVHMENFNSFKEVLSEFGRSVEDNTATEEILLPGDCLNICSILGKNIVRYTKNQDSKITYKISDKATQVVYFTSTKPHFEETEILNTNELAARVLTYIQVQNNEVPNALKVLNVLGDKFYIRKLYNTFTQEEYAEVENELLKAIFDSRKRYKEGKVKNYLPDDNEFCVLDALDVISNDNAIKIHLNDPDFTYLKISRPSEQQDGSKLEYPKNIEAYANNLKYHESRLNVNLNVTYEAYVPLIPENFTKTNAINEKLEDYGFKKGQKYPVNCIRNYNIILDGKLQTKKLILSRLSKDSINKLSSILTLRDDKKYILDMSQLSVINKSYLKTTSAKNLAALCWKAYIKGIELSVLNNYIKVLSPQKPEDLTKQEQFLLDNFYIKKGIYQPPVSQVESTDEYLAYEFIVKFKGWSKPTASTVINKLNEGKTLTQRELLIKPFYESYSKLSLKELKIKKEEINKEYKLLQSQIQHAKFAIILINRGCMDEFKSRENMNIDIQTDQGIVNAQFEVVQKPVKM